MYMAETSTAGQDSREQNKMTDQDLGVTLKDSCQDFQDEVIPPKVSTEQKSMAECEPGAMEGTEPEPEEEEKEEEKGGEQAMQTRRVSRNKGPISLSPAPTKRRSSASPSPGGIRRKTPRTSPSPKCLSRKASPRGASPWGKSPNQGRAGWKSPKQRTGLSPRSRRKSWRRSISKAGARGRRSLPALPKDSAGLSQAISIEMPEHKRLAKLFQESVQFAIQKLETSLKPTEEVDLQEFKADITNEVNLLTESLEREGAFQKCTDKPQDVPPNPEMKKAMDEVRESVERLTGECKAWGDLLHKHKSGAEDILRSLEQAKVSGVPLPPEQDLGLLDPSVAAVLRSKPDYQRILRGQIPVVSRLDLVMDSHQKLLRSLRSFQDEAERTLKETSSRLAASAFEGLEGSPVKKLLHLPKSC
ncbi:kinetochore-associated protein DSN1 homolog [Acipenser ruthenus]|uniref:kinetochore-associated protein DSN1 homolog n=1 Tax=Acipenser ruthenus TaxID=7906 RepID=UPI00274113BA|nr:kinetochore-associated protein DSN1 homolog [Acipenser ruthenus]